MESQAGTDAAEMPSKGVRKRGDKWVAEIRNRRLKRGRHPGRKWLGTFSSAAEAREAYLQAAGKIIQPQKSLKSRATVRSPQVDDSSSSRNFSSSLFIPSGGRERNESEHNAPPSSKRSQRTGVKSGPVGRPPSTRLKIEAPKAGPIDSGEWNLEQESDLAADLEPGGVQETAYSRSLAIPAKDTHSAFKFIWGTATDALDASNEVQQGPFSTPYAEVFNSSYSEHCQSGSPSSSATSKFSDADINNQSHNRFSVKNPSCGKQGDDSVNDTGERGSETAQVLPEVIDNVSVSSSTGTLEPLSLFCYSSSISLNDYLTFAAVSRDERYCAWVDQASISNLCLCSVIFIEKQKHCPTSICVWNHTKPCPLARSSLKENEESVPGHDQRQYLAHVDEMRIKTQNFSAFKTKHLISELEAEAFVDDGFPPVSLLAAESSGSQLSATSATVRMGTENHTPEEVNIFLPVP
ncbi:hypothetical protein R1flu_001510 [Riccia fluitans]|uniref:AP2/ERF domain-containing protein n=1 Tax=Riccia fluitans TaxID=41844 RepID=A0ABD1Y3Y1_9MARC